MLKQRYIRAQRARPENQNTRSRGNARSFSSARITHTYSNIRMTLSRKRLILFTYIAYLAFFGVAGTTLLGMGVVAFFSRDLPNPNRLLERSAELSTKIFDRNGTPIFEVYGEKNRSVVSLDNVSQDIVHATLAVEDANFYQHSGYSPIGVLRAIKNMVFGGSLQSGSTLTQQVVKNALLTQDQTVTRKIKELILSSQLENVYEKDQILQMYLNETPYGGQNYGVQTASKAYFNKDPKDLTLAESAYLAGLPQSPTYYSHYGPTPEAGIERQKYVLKLMYERGWSGKDAQRYYISEEDYNKALEQELVFQTALIPFKAPHFVFYVRQQLTELFGEEQALGGGFQVKTSLDLDLQDKLQDIVFKNVENAGNLNIGNGGVVAIDPRTGGILAMVGSKGYFLQSEPEGCISGTTGENSCTFEPNLNVTTALRQPGSTIKPITYATMLEQGYSPAFPFLDVPTSFPGESPDKPYQPVNYDGTFKGPVTLRKALGNSLNITAVKALKIVGIDNMINQAEKMGISTFGDRKRFGLALTLGGGETKLLEMTSAFGVFANQGKLNKPTAILEVRDSQGNLLYENKPEDKQVLSKETAFLISDILSDDGARADAFGAGSLLYIRDHQVAVKTGTTDDKRDNYAIGFTPSIVIGSWVGNNNNDRMNPYVASGISGATPIWRESMLSYLEGKSKEKFEAPSTVAKIEVDSLTGMKPFSDEPKRSEWFKKGTEPTAVSDWYQKLEVCKVDGRLASEACRKADKTEVKTFVNVRAELSEWQTEVDSWVRKNFASDSKYFPPQTESKVQFDDSGDVKDSNDVFVQFIGYKDGDKVPLSFRLGVEVSSGADIKAVKIYQDGSKVTEDGSAPFGYNFSFSLSDVGEHEFNVTAENEDGKKGEATIKLKVTASSN